MIETQRLIIKKWSQDLAQDFLNLTEDSGFTAYPITDYRQKDLESAKAWISKNVGKFAVIEKQSGSVIGMGGLTPWTLDGQAYYDLTYRLSSVAHGKGYGFELAQALVAFGFDQMKLDQITATITPDNIPSKRLAEKLGMKFDRKIVLLGVETDLYRLYKIALNAD